MWLHVLRPFLRFWFDNFFFLFLLFHGIFCVRFLFFSFLKACSPHRSNVRICNVASSFLCVCLETHFNFVSFWIQPKMSSMLSHDRFLCNHSIFRQILFYSAEICDGSFFFVDARIQESNSIDVFFSFAYFKGHDSFTIT